MKNLYFFSTAFIILFSIPAFAQWESIDGPYTDIFIMELKQKDSLVFAGTECGLFVKNVSQQKWKRLSNYSTTRIEFKGDSVFTGSNQGFGVIDLNSSPLSEANINPLGIPFANRPPFSFHDTIMFAGSAEGVNISYDYGLTYQPYLTGLDMDTISVGSGTSYLLSIFDIQVTANYVFCATANGVYRSSFDLSGWTLKSPVMNTATRGVYAFNGNLYAHDLRNLYRSLDNGDSWTIIHAGGQSDLIKDFLEANGNLYLINGSGNILKSSDNGATWQSMSSGLSGQFLHGIRNINNSLYLFTQEGFYKWDGSTWAKHSEDGIYCTQTASVQSTSSNVILTDWEGVYKLKGDGTYTDITPRVGRGWTYGVSRVKNDTLFVPARYFSVFGGTDSSKIFYTYNNGINWQPVEGPVFSSSYLRVNTDLRFYGDTMYVMGDGELFYSLDLGQTWVDISPTNLNCQNVYDILYRNGQLYLAGCNKSWVYQHNGGHLWTTAADFDPGYAQGFMERDSVVFLTYENDIKRKFPSANWGSAANGLGAQFFVYNYLNLNQNLFITTSEGVFKTENYGNTWVGFNDGWVEPDQIFPVNLTILGDTMYAGSYMKGIYKRAIPAKPVSLKEEDKKSVVRIYPNPASTNITISLRSGQNGELSITDQNGRVLHKQDFVDSELIELPELPVGLYILNVESGNRKTEHKLIIRD